MRSQHCCVALVWLVAIAACGCAPQREVDPPAAERQGAAATERQERGISVEVQVPTAGYHLNIAEVRATENGLWVIARLSAPAGGFQAQVVSRVSDQVIVKASEDLEVRTIVIGPEPRGLSNPQHRFVESMVAAEGLVPQGARVIYQDDSQPGRR